MCKKSQSLCKDEGYFLRNPSIIGMFIIYIADHNMVDFSMITTLVQNLGWDKSAEEQAISDAFAGQHCCNKHHIDILYFINI